MFLYVFSVDVVLCIYFYPGGGVSVVGGVVQLVLLFQELWRRSQESGETLSHTEVVCSQKTMRLHVLYICLNPQDLRKSECKSTLGVQVHINVTI